jgi:betaine-aldehyde dehydrogenase
MGIDLGLAATHAYIGGEWTPGASTGSIPVFDSGTGTEMGRVAHGAAADVDKAVAAARAAFPAWAATPHETRVAHVQALIGEIERRAGALATLMTRETGTPISQSHEGQVGLAVNILRSFVTGARSIPWEEQIGNSLVVREPVGVIGAIVPWNYPLGAIATKVGAALVAGCTIVVKPSEVAPLDAVLFAEAVTAAAVPPGVVNLVFGTGIDAGEPLVRHDGVDFISFTGSTRAGSRIAAVAAASVKPVSLELGGKSASVVLEDGDLATAVRACVEDCMVQLNGQACDALSRLVIPRDLLSEAEELAHEHVSLLTVGDPLDPDTTVGPLASRAQQDDVLSKLDRAVADGARTIAGGPGRPDGLAAGYFVRPTVFSGVEPSDAIAQEEVFGPVVCLIAHDGEDDALAIANGTPYGLGGAVWSADTERAVGFARRMRTGQVDVNAAEYNYDAPFGGFGRSGYGRELGRFGIEEFLAPKSIQR